MPAPNLAGRRPERRVYLGLTANPTDAVSTVAWTEVTDWVEDSSITSSGREHELNRTASASASLRLDNTDRRFDPANTASPYSPNLLPQRRLRIVDRWPPNLLTANQASFETDTSGWAVHFNATIARTTAQALNGAASLRITSTADGLAQVKTTPIAIEAGDLHSALAALRPVTTARTWTISVDWLTAAEAYISTSETGPLAETTGVWVTARLLAQAPATAAKAVVLVNIQGTVAGEQHDLDTVLFARGDHGDWLAGGGTDTDRFTGYVVDWPATWSAFGQSHVQIEAVGVLAAVVAPADVPASSWEVEVRKDIAAATVKAAWYRLGETGDQMVDSSGFNLHGTYQGDPDQDVGGLVAGDTDGGFTPNRNEGPGQRGSAPYKSLITGYPFTIEFLMRTTQDRLAYKAIFVAYDGPNVPGQFLEVGIQSGTTAFAGRLVMAVRSGGVRRLVNSGIYLDDGQPHHIALVATSASDIKVWTDGFDSTTIGDGGSPAFPNDLVTGYAIGNTPAVVFGDFSFGTTASDVLDEVVVYDGLALSFARITAHNTAAKTGWVGDKTGTRISRVLTEAVGLNAADVTVDAGISTVAPHVKAGSALAYVLKVEEAEDGYLYETGSGRVGFLDRHKALSATSVATFGEGTGEIGYSPAFRHGIDDGDLWNEWRGNRDGGGTEQVVKDATSQTKYGKRVNSSLSGLLLTLDNEVQDRLKWGLLHYKDPVTRVRQIVVDPQEDPDRWPTLLALKTRDKVTVKAAPPGGGPELVVVAHIERWTESVTPTEWTLTYSLSAADTGNYFKLGTSALDGTAVLAY